MNPFTTHGAISWAELQTSDPVAATEFYTKVLGWTSETMEMDMGPYTVVKAGDLQVGGIMATQQPGMPPCWTLYVTVDNIDAIAAKASELGGTVLVPVMDVPTIGKFCGIQDPQGAFLMAMEYAATDDGQSDLDFANGFTTHGAISWSELRTPDPEGARKFYSGLFGWTFDTQEMPTGPYSSIQVGGTGIGGIIQPPQEGVPPHWGLYITVDDVDAVNAAATSAGATAHGPTVDVEKVGRFSFLQDPQGAMFSPITYVPMDVAST